MIYRERSTQKMRAEALFFSPTASAKGVFSPDKLRCVPVRVAGAGSGGRFRKVPESSGVCAGGSGEFRCVLV